jgi:hypothetical protein
MTEADERMDRESLLAGAVNALLVDAFPRTKVGSGAFEKFFAVVRDELDKLSVRPRNRNRAASPASLLYRCYVCSWTSYSPCGRSSK